MSSNVPDFVMSAPANAKTWMSLGSPFRFLRELWAQRTMDLPRRVKRRRKERSEATIRDGITKASRLPHRWHRHFFATSSTSVDLRHNSTMPMDAFGVGVLTRYRNAHSIR